MSTLGDASNATAVAPYHISDWERTTYYHGISDDPPELLYRSDLLTNPLPKPVGRMKNLPTKTVHGVYNTPLNAVWDTVGPQIRDLVKERKIRYSAIHPARFSTDGEDGDSLGPIVIWIATHPTTTTAEQAHDASLAILALLESNGVKDIVVEWYEGVVEKLSGPPLLRVAADSDPTKYVRRFLTAKPGMPISTAVREDEDAQGSVALFFHEKKDKCGRPSAKVFGVSNCHVLRKNTNVGYEFKGTGAPPQLVRIAGFRRFQRGLDEVNACIDAHKFEAETLARAVAELEAKPMTRSEDLDEAAAVTADAEAKQIELFKSKGVIDAHEKFYNELKSQWCDIKSRNIGHVDWAPKISVDVVGLRYTKDIGTFEVDPARFKPHFKGNVVDLGTFCPIFFS